MPQRYPGLVPPKGHPDARRREPLWDRVDANRLKLAAFVVLFVVSVMVVFDVLLFVFGGCLIAAVLFEAEEIEMLGRFLHSDPLGPFGWVSLGFGLAALIWALVVLSRSEKWLLERFHATLVPKGELIDTKMALKDMAIATGLPVSPALHIIEHRSVNAFVFSAHRRRAVLGVTRGLVEKLSVDEQRAVFANLIARLVSGDTIVDTGVATLMWPLNAWRHRNLERDDGVPQWGGDSPGSGRSDSGASIGLVFLLFGIALAIVGEVFAFGQRRRHLRAAEKGDAEGMLLLKDPSSMLSALEKAVYYDNLVPGAWDTFADLFYCWTGDGTSDENDPEWERVARLREVLGVEGVVPVARSGAGAGGTAARAPRLDEA
jgi:Zn-dependent protease with chaperone function